MGGRGRSRVDTKLLTAKGGGDALHWGKRRGGGQVGDGGKNSNTDRQAKVHAHTQVHNKQT